MTIHAKEVIKTRKRFGKTAKALARLLLVEGFKWFEWIRKVSKKYAEQGVEQDNVGGEHDPVDQFLCTGIEVIIIPFEKGFQYKTGLGCEPVHNSLKLKRKVVNNTFQASMMRAGTRWFSWRMVKC